MRGSRCLACLIPSLLLAFGVIGTAKANVPPLRLVRTLANPGAIDGDQFGYSVAFAGARLLVGARFADLGGTDTGAAYLFDGTDGTLLQTLQQPSPAAGDWFGNSVAAVGDNVLSGALGVDTPVHDAGAGFLFDGKTGEVLLTLQEPEPHDSDWFGATVAAAGSNLLVGAPLDHVGDVEAGGAYLFDGSTGKLLQSFHQPKLQADDWFGVSLAAVGDNVLVGAFLDNTGASGAGAAYLFDGKTGALIRSLQKPKPAANDQFGLSMAVLGNSIIIGAPGDSTGKKSAGAVYLFDADTGAFQRMLQNPTPVAGEQFGTAVAAFGSSILVGAPADSATKPGAAYLFDATSGALLQSFQNPKPAAGDGFGTSVAAGASGFLIGAPGDMTSPNVGGAAYLYQP
jgi:hypothetical protein